MPLSLRGKVACRPSCQKVSQNRMFGRLTTTLPEGSSRRTALRSVAHGSRRCSSTSAATMQSKRPSVALGAASLRRMSLGSFLVGAALFVAMYGSVAFASARVSGRFGAPLAGPSRTVAAIVVFLALLIGVHMFAGLLGILSRWTV